MPTYVLSYTWDSKTSFVDTFDIASVAVQALPKSGDCSETPTIQQKIQELRLLLMVEV